MIWSRSKKGAMSPPSRAILRTELSICAMSRRNALWKQRTTSIGLNKNLRLYCLITLTDYYAAGSSLRVCFTCETSRRLQVRFRWSSRHVLVGCPLHLRGRIRFLGHRPLSHAIYLRPRLRNGALDRNLFWRWVWRVLTIAIQVDKYALIPSCHLLWCFPSLHSEEIESHQVSENSFFAEPNFFTDSPSGCSWYKQLWL